MGGAAGQADHAADLVERKPAPNMGDDDLALIAGERLQGGGNAFGVDVADRPAGDRDGPLPGRFRFVSPPPACRPPGIHRPVANRPVQPRQQLARSLSTSGQIDQCILNRVFRTVAQLPRVQHQRSPVPIDQMAEQIRTNRPGSAVTFVVHHL
jgi:hypothetical protein